MKGTYSMCWVSCQKLQKQDQPQNTEFLYHPQMGILSQAYLRAGERLMAVPRLRFYSRTWKDLFSRILSHITTIPDRLWHFAELQGVKLLLKQKHCNRKPGFLASLVPFQFPLAADSSSSFTSRSRHGRITNILISHAHLSTGCRNSQMW